MDPLLFLLYINDFSTVISNSKVKLFADDFTIYKEVSSTDDVKLHQVDLANIVNWAKKWLLPSNVDSITLSNIRNLDSAVFSHQPVNWHLGVLQNSVVVIIVNTFQPKPQDCFTLFVAVYILLLLLLNLLLTDVQGFQQQVGSPLWWPPMGDES